MCGSEELLLDTSKGLAKEVVLLKRELPKFSIGGV